MWIAGLWGLQIPKLSDFFIKNHINQDGPEKI